MRKLLGLVLVLLVSACAVRVPIEVTHPAEIDMTRYKEVAILEIDGNMGRDFSDGLKNALVEGERFKVVDRNRMSQIMKELNISQSDLADEKKRLKLGKLMSASALISGHAEGDYKEQDTSMRMTCKYTNGQQYPCTMYGIKGVFKTGGSIDVIDVQTGQILRSKVIKASCEKKSQSYIADTPAPAIDSDALKTQCLNTNVNTFLKAISPWKEIVQVLFMNDEKIPDLDKGINQAKIGDLKEAINTFASAAKAAEGSKIEAKSIAKAYWNMGLAYEYSWEFDKAKEMFKKALSLDPSASERISKEMSNCDRLKREREKLSSQGGA